MKELVEFLARSLVDKPDEVYVDAVQSGRTTIFEIEAAEDDVGKLIGRQGRVVRAIRTLVKAAAIRTGQRVDVDVV